MTHPYLNVLLGPPGTGKTTALLSIIQRELEAGTRPQSIAFLAFTKKAAQEAIERACERFGYVPTDLPYFRTIHSLCFKRLGLRPDLVMQTKHYRELGDRMGLDLKPGNVAEDWYGMDAGDRMLFLEGLARVKRVPLRSVYDEADEPDVDFRQLDHLARSLARYKQTRGLLDYTDMLEEFVREAKQVAPVLDALIVDEAQDLSVLQWQAVDAVAAKAKRVYVAGDDDQAIYRWAGADVDSFMNLRGHTTVLGQSYRIPASVHSIADRIVRQMAKRTAKVWKPRTEAGAVQWYMDPEEIDISPSTGTWLLLARNGYMLRELEDLCRRRGFSYETATKDSPLSSPALKAIIAYTRMLKGVKLDRPDVELVLKYMSVRKLGLWGRRKLRDLPSDRPVGLSDFQGVGFPEQPPMWTEMLDKISSEDKEYFIAARKQGETLTGTPRIRISTIHASKGGEADNVALLTDMSARTMREMERKPDDEHRVFYVAVTRARKALHLVQPRTGNCYEL